LNKASKIIKQNKLFLLLILAASLATKIIFFYLFLINNPCKLAFDSAHYNEIATNIVTKKSICSNDGSAQFYRLPGYPAFLASCYKFFGININKTLLTQVAISALIPILIFILSISLFPGNIAAAKLAAIISIFHIGFLIYSGLVLSDVLFLIMFLIFMILFLPSFSLFFTNKKLILSANQMFMCGIILGVASLVRPVGHYLLLLSILMLLCSTFSIHKKIKAVASFFVGWIIPVLPWLLRNYMLTGCLFFHTLPGPHFMNHLATRIIMEKQDCTYRQANKQLVENLREKIHEKESEAKRQIYEIERCKIAEQITKNVTLYSPLIAAKLMISNIFKTCFSLYSSELLFIDSSGQLPEYSHKRTFFSMVKRFLWPKVQNKSLILLIYFEILVFLFLLVGSFLFILESLFLNQSIDITVKFILFSTLFVLISLAVGYARFRLPIEPFLIIAASRFLISTKALKLVF
jgi:hypothetical protein